MANNRNELYITFIGKTYLYIPKNNYKTLFGGFCGVWASLCMVESSGLFVEECTRICINLP